MRQPGFLPARRSLGFASPPHNGFALPAAHGCAREYTLLHKFSESAMSFEEMSVFFRTRAFFPYGNPTIDFSVASVNLVSAPAPPFRESLPRTPSRKLSASSPLCPYRLSAPPPPFTLSAPPQPRSISLPPSPSMVSLPPKPQMMSAAEVPLRVSAAEVPLLVQLLKVAV